MLQGRGGVRRWGTIGGTHGCLRRDLRARTMQGSPGRGGRQAGCLMGWQRDGVASALQAPSAAVCCPCCPLWVLEAENSPLGSSAAGLGASTFFTGAAAASAEISTSTASSVNSEKALATDAISALVWSANWP